MSIAEILKHCETGMKLYSSIHGEVEFIYIDKYNEKYPIVCKNKIECAIFFTNNGRIYYNYPNTECVLFPSKTQRDWNKFRIPIKKGDIMMKIDGTSPFIATGELYENISPKYICGINSLGNFQIDLNKESWTSDFYIPASEKAKKELFIKMGIAGYTWNARTLKLEKIKPKYRPFIKREECWQEMLKHQPFGWIKEAGDKYNIIFIGKNGIIVNNGVGNGYRSFKDAFNLTFDDDIPFGIKE